MVEGVVLSKERVEQYMIGYGARITTKCPFTYWFTDEGPRFLMQPDTPLQVVVVDRMRDSWLVRRTDGTMMFICWPRVGEVTHGP